MKGRWRKEGGGGRRYKGNFYGRMEAVERLDLFWGKLNSAGGKRRRKISISTSDFFFSFKFCAVKDGLLVKYLEFVSLLNPASAPAPAPAPAFPSLAPEGALLLAPIFHPADQQVCWP